MNKNEQPNKKISALDSNLNAININLTKMNSTWWNLWLSIVRGVGTVIGATVLAALLLLLLSWLTQLASGIPIFKNIADALKQSKILKK